MMKKKKILALGMTLMLSAGVFAGCGGDSKETTAPAANGETTAASEEAEKVLTFGCQMYDDGSVSQMQTSSSWNCMRYGIGEALFKFADDMSIEPWLAESYTVSDDHLTWTIKLKDGIKFSDGCELTASKVAAQFDYLKTECAEASSKPAKYLEFEATYEADDAANTITITTSKVYDNLPGQLAYPVMSILDIEHITDFNNGAIGTGPYMIDKFNGVGVGYDMKANPEYREAVPYDAVKILFMGDASAKAMALQAGQVDLVENITNVADIQTLQNDDKFTVDIAAGVRCGFSWINFTGVLKNDALRQAVLMGIDYDTICASNTIGGLYTPGFSVLPSNLSYGYDKLNNPYTYDPEGAKKLLDDAGIIDTDGNGIRELDGKDVMLHYVSYENRLLNDFSDAHALYLKEIGIGVDADYGSSDDQWNKLSALDYDLNNNNWTTVGTGDPFEYMANWTTEAGYCGYSNEEYDALYEQLKGELDHEKRAELFQQMQQILIDDAAVLIDGYYNSSMIYNNSKIGYAHIHTADYYWLTTEIVPAK